MQRCMNKLTTFFCMRAVPWAPGGSKFARNPPVPEEVRRSLQYIPKVLDYLCPAEERKLAAVSYCKFEECFD